MTLEFEFPDTGEGVTEGKFLEWLVEEGEEVEEDQSLAEVETDKAVIEVPSPAEGTIKNLKASPGDIVEVGQVILEMNTEKAEEKQKTREKESKKVKKEEEEETNQDRKSDQVLALPKVRKLAERKNVSLQQIDKEGRITEKDVLEKAETTEEESKTEETTDVKATPSVRRLAREKDVEISKIEGTGKNGKITRKDVLDKVKSEPKTREVKNDQGKSVERISMNSVRKNVAEKMEKARFTAPHVTHTEKADVSRLVQIREKEKEKVETHLTYLPFIIKSCVQALENHPKLNAELDEEKDEIILKKYYDFNIAVDTEKGLMVPKIESLDTKNILKIAKDINKRVKQAKNGELTASDMKGGTFSITNLGVIGGEEFTPIINYPQVAILGVGEIKETAEVIDKEIKPRKTVQLSLSYDHRVVDGAEAARFMNEVVEKLENPGDLMVNL